VNFAAFGWCWLRPYRTGVLGRKKTKKRPKKKSGIALEKDGLKWGWFNQAVCHSER